MAKTSFFEFSLPVMVLKEQKRYVAYTPALDLSTSGKTLAQAQKRFTEAARLFFEELVRMETLDQVLGDLGWHKQKQEWKAPVMVSKNMESFSVPVCA